MDTGDGMNQKPEKDTAGTVFLVYIGAMAALPLIVVITMIATK